MLKNLRDFLRLEASGGIVLMLVAVWAMMAANSPLAPHYQALFASKLSFWINDGLMVIFFLLIGIEIKREINGGELATRQQALLPCVAALGGVLLPAIIYSVFNWNKGTMQGWAIPTATDIAFSLGVLALFGSRLPSSLKIFLMAVAVIDDLVAVVIIGVFYTKQLDVVALAYAGICAYALWYCGRNNHERIRSYVLLGLLMWASMLQSGIHPTIAGVLLGLFMPLNIGARVTGKLHGWVAFGILPLFAFANAGIPLAGLSFEQLTSPVTSGIALGLFFGKQIGIFIASGLLIRFGFAKLPSGANWLGFYAVCMIAGIGFTMSLFIGSLAFFEPMLQLHTRLGVIIGSLLSVISGSILLTVALRRKSGGT